MKKIKTEQVAAQEDLLQQLVSDYTTQKQQSLMQMKKGQLSKEAFLAEAAGHIAAYYKRSKKQDQQLLDAFEQYVFGYSRLSKLIDDRTVSDIRVVGYDNVRIKRKGQRI